MQVEKKTKIKRTNKNSVIHVLTDKRRYNTVSRTGCWRRKDEEERHSKEGEKERLKGVGNERKGRSSRTEMERDTVRKKKQAVREEIMRKQEQALRN